MKCITIEHGTHTAAQHSENETTIYHDLGDQTVETSDVTQYVIGYFDHGQQIAANQSQNGPTTKQSH